VTDTGQGIKPDFLPHIFERFRQEDATSKRNQGGLGLGLAIVKHLVEMHGGTVAAESEGEGRGATFVVRIPIAAMKPEVDAVAAHAQGTLASSTGSQRPLSPSALRGVRVLVVEDDADARTLLTRSLLKAGAEVLDAASVSIALELLPAFHPNVLISDLGMPDQDGYDLIREIRARGLTPGDLPAIALTAFARNEDEERSLLAGFQVHLAKPVDQNQLIAAVASVARPARNQG
jgi:CheY-like chemotaxis protein